MYIEWCQEYWLPFRVEQLGCFIAQKLSQSFCHPFMILTTGKGWSIFWHFFLTPWSPGLLILFAELYCYNDCTNTRWQFLICLKNFRPHSQFFFHTVMSVFSLSDELWKLTRSPHLKKTDALKLDQAVGNYSLQNTPFMHFNNTEDSCRINAGSHLNPASLVLTSAAAITLFRRLYWEIFSKTLSLHTINTFDIVFISVFTSIKKNNFYL